MNLEKKLKKMGIEDAKEINNETIKIIAYNVCEALTKTFPYVKEEYEKIYNKLINCKMYVANITKPISRVNYIHENSSIYFEEKMDFNKLDEQTLHECIHYLQEYRNTEGKLIRIGLCNLNEFKVWGLGLNEAIVQYMSAKCFHGNPKLVEKYDITLKTNSPEYYSFLTNLAEQLVYVLEEENIVKATLHSDILFKDKLFDIFEGETNKILSRMDKIVETNNVLIYENNTAKIEKMKNQIIRLYLETQNAIFSVFFDNICFRLTSVEEVEKYNEKAIYYINNIMGFENGKNYEKNIILQETNRKFNNRLIQINRNRSKMSLAVIKISWLEKILKKIYAYFE